MLDMTLLVFIAFFFKQIAAFVMRILYSSNKVDFYSRYTKAKDGLRLPLQLYFTTSAISKVTQADNACTIKNVSLFHWYVSILKCEWYCYIHVKDDHSSLHASNIGILHTTSTFVP